LLGLTVTYSVREKGGFPEDVGENEKLRPNSSTVYGLTARLTDSVGPTSRATVTEYVTVCPGNAYLISGSAFTLKFQAKTGTKLPKIMEKDNNTTRTRLFVLLLKADHLRDTVKTPFYAFAVRTLHLTSGRGCWRL
jgi:hypothetical protein